MNNYGIISVRTASTRLPSKCLMPFGDGNVLEHMIRRAKHLGFTPVVATTGLREDDIVQEIALREGVLCFRGSAEDKLQRWHDTCNHFNIPKFVTLDGDDLFFDPDLAKCGLVHLEDYDIIYPPQDYYVGSFSFAMTRDIVERACKIKDSDNTEMAWHFIEKVEGVRKLKLPPRAYTKFRLTLDYPEDYWLLAMVRRLLGNFAEANEIVDLFKTNPDLYKVNWFRQEEMERRQEVGGSGLF